MSDDLDFDMEVVKNENASSSSAAEVEEKEDAKSQSSVSQDADTSSADGRSSGSEESHETNSGESLAGSLRQPAESSISGWDVVRLGDVLELEYGDNLPERDREDGSVPVYGSNGRVDTHSEPAVSAPGLVLGRKGSIGEIVLSESPFWPIDTTYYITREETSLNLRYLQNLLQALQLESLNAASAIPGLNRNDVYNLRVIVPPLPEQRKIASVLYAVDQAIQKTEAIIEQAKRVKRGLMQDLLVGGIDRTNQIRNPDQDPELFRETALGRVPEDWKMVPLREACHEIVDSPHSTPDYSQEGVLIVRTSDIEEGRFVPDEAKRVTEEDYQERVSRLEPKPGDVVFTREAPVGEAFKIPEDTRLCLGQRTMAFRPKETVLSPDFLVQSIYSYRIQKRFDQLVVGTTNPHLNVGTIRNFKIPVPSIVEQEQIVSVLRSVDDQVEEGLERKVRLKNLKKGLMQDLLTGEVRTADKAIDVLDEVEAHG